MNIGVSIFLTALCLAGVSECLQCFNCQNIADPNDCRNTTQCSSDQLCSSSAVHPIIGRSIQTRQLQSCHECCGNDRCNDHMCAYRKPSECTDDETLDCPRLSSIFNLCADVHHAKITCPKFCGLCQLVDGEWTQWGAWTTCSVTCSNGLQTRTRTCTNPPPSNGGLNCTGLAIESQLCTHQLCPVHGNWSEWSTWSTCTVTCDVGLRKRSRACTNPRPERFGDNCYGDASEYTVCQANPCNNPVHGNWSDWSTWSDCSVTCDVGLRKRSRACTNPRPDRNGDYCVGDPFENTVCLQEPCSNRNGGWSSWGPWQSCSVTCGGGLKLRNRTCTNPSPTLFGKACEGNSETFAVCANTACHAVAFNAHGLNVLSNDVNAFPTVIFNEGNAYNASTGHFTAPVDGIYFFSAQICSQPGYGLYFYLEKGDILRGGERLTATIQYEYISFSCTSASSSVKLTMNEHVWVLMGGHYPKGVVYEATQDVWITFTGTLIQEL